MIRPILLTLVLSLITVTGFADVTLEELVRDRNRRHENQGVPEVTVSYYPSTPKKDVVLSSVDELTNFSAFHSGRLVFPDQYEVSMTRGGHYLDANCLPFLDRIQIDETAWTYGTPVLYHGLLGHELGHLVFKSTMSALLRANLKFNTPDYYRQLSRQIITDRTHLDRHLQILARRGSSVPSLEGNMLNTAEYRMAEALIRAYEFAEEGEDEKLKQLSGDDLLTHILMESLAGFQEVYSDFVGAVHTGDPAFMTQILTTPASKLVRDFTRQISITHPSIPQEVREEILRSASRGIPHLLLYELRQEIYHQFYLSNGTWIGANPDYDSAVMAKLLSSLFKVFLKKIREPEPKVKVATATMALLYKEIIGDLVVEYEVEARAFCTQYNLRRVYLIANHRHELAKIAQGMSVSTTEELYRLAYSLQRLNQVGQCGNSVASQAKQQEVSPRLAKFRARQKGARQQNGGQQMRHRENGQ